MKPMNSIRITSRHDLEKLERIPVQEHLSAQNTYTLIKNSAESHTDKIALRFVPQVGGSDVCYCYGDLFKRITKTANAFHSLGVGVGDTVTMLLPNIPQAHFTLWGAEAAGIVNPINPFLDVDHMGAIMREANSKVLVTLAPFHDSDLWDKAVKLVDEVPSLTTILTVDVAQFFSASNVKRTVPNLPDHCQCQVLDFDDYTDQFDGVDLVSQRVIAADDIAAYFHTGGTTGTPKLAPHTHFNEAVNAWQIATCLDINSSDVGLCGLPLFHVNAPIVTGLAAFLRGAEIVLLTPEGYRNASVISNIWRVVERYRATFFSAVPTVIGAMLNVDVKGHDISSLRAALCGAATLPQEVKRQFEVRTGLTLVEGYGQTEGTCASTANPLYGEHRSGSVGLPLPYMQVRIVAVDDQGRAIRDCDEDEVGCIVIKGPNVFSGYVQEDKNNELWADVGWLNTGDLGRLDRDGYLWLTGRSKDLIIRGGHNIDPVVIEEALHMHPAVAAAAAVGKPDIKAGELPVAYVQLQAGHTASCEEILRYAAEHISERAAVPKEIYFVDSLPLTAVGKVFKPDLRRDVIARTCREVLADINLSGEVVVDACDQHGQVAQIRLASDAVIAIDELRGKLELFHFKYQIIS